MPGTGIRVYVGGLPDDFRDSELRDEFRSYYPISVEMKQGRGYGFVEFGNEDDADDAIKDLNGIKIDGKRISVQRAKERIFTHGSSRRDGAGGGSGGGGSSRAIRSKWKIEVEGLGDRTSWQDLKDFGRGAGGQVTFANVWKEGGRNYGVLEYPDQGSMEDAIRKLDDTKLSGVRVRLYAQNSGRGRSPSYDRARDRYRRSRSHDSRSRSRSRSKGRGSRRSRSYDRRDYHDKHRGRSLSPHSNNDRDKERDRSRDPERDRIKSRDAYYPRDDERDKEIHDKEKDQELEATSIPVSLPSSSSIAAGM